MSADNTMPGTQVPNVAWVSLADAAPAYGVSVDTLRRRMRRGELTARREVVPQGFRWLVPLPDAPQPVSNAPGRDASPAHGSELIAAPDHDATALIETLRQELATRNQEIGRLHDIIATQAQALARIAAPGVGDAAPAAGMPDQGAGPAAPTTSFPAPGAPPARETITQPSAPARAPQRGLIALIVARLRGRG